MEKHRSATFLVALGLLGSFVAISVEAQGWTSKGAPPPPPQIPQVHPPPKNPQYEQGPQILLPAPPKAVPRPQEPKVAPQPPQSLGFPPIRIPQPSQVQTPPKYPNTPQIQPGPPPVSPGHSQGAYVSPPKYPNTPQTRPGPPPVSPGHPKDPFGPQIQPPRKYPDTPQIQPGPPPVSPGHSHGPYVSPPKYPNTPQTRPGPPPVSPGHPKDPFGPQIQPPRKYHDTPQIQPGPPPVSPGHSQGPYVSPPKYPNTPQTRPGPPPVSPGHSQDRYVPQPKYPNTPQIQPGPPPVSPGHSQDRYVPQPKYPNTPQTRPGPPPVSPGHSQDRYVPQPKYPNTPQTRPGPPPVSPGHSQDRYVPQPKYPNTPQTRPGPPPVSPGHSQGPYVPPPTYPNTPQTRPGPPPVSPGHSQGPYVPPPTYPNTPQTRPGKPPVSQGHSHGPYVSPPKYPNTQPGSSGIITPSFPGRQPQPHQPKFGPRSFSKFEPPQEPQVPQPQQPHQPPPKDHSIHQPKQPTFQSCEVGQNARVPCGAPDISAAACEAISCCFDGRQCYFGKAVTVQCTKDAQFIVVVARDATLPNIDLESISLLGEGQGCTHVDSNSEFAIYQFPVTACGSLVMEEPGVIIYENRMSSSFEVGVGPLGAITRDSHYDLLFQCRYIGTSVETVVAEVLPLDIAPPGVAAYGPIDVHLRLANGQCHAKGCNELDVAFTSYYTDADYPVPKVLRDPVYVEVFLAGKTDPNLVLTLGRCWTTTTPNPHSLPQWDILIDGCPYRDDRYMSALIPVDASSGVAFPTHCRRFLFKMFTFVDSSSMVPLREQVYIHCSTAVCTGGSCEPSCYRHKRDVKAVEQREAEPKVVVSIGPVIMGQ